MAPLAPRSPAVVAEKATRVALSSDERLTLAQAINVGLAAVLERHPNALLFGEDIAVKGGVYGVTRGLHARFGAGRVFDTLLDETSILGLALGAAVSGFLPIPEIQYLAYLHNAEDQLRGEAATLQFFSQRAYRNGMVIRIAGYGYQQGFGGHFHNDDAVGVLRDIPGVVIASPARPDDAASMLVTCSSPRSSTARSASSSSRSRSTTRAMPLRRATRRGSPALFGARSDRRRADDRRRDRPDDRDLGERPAPLRAGGGRLAGSGIRARLVDLRWLAPLPVEDVLREASATGRVLVVDETRRTGGVSEGVIAELVDAGFEGRIGRVASKDSFVPLGDAARLVLVSEEEIEAAALSLLA